MSGAGKCRQIAAYIPSAWKLCAALCLIVILCICININTVLAAEQDSPDQGASAVTEGLTDDLLGELQTGDLENFLNDQSADAAMDLSFSELIGALLSGEQVLDGQTVWNWFVNHCFDAVHSNREYLAQMLVLLLAFAMLQGITGIFSNAFLSDMSFLAVYFLFLYNGGDVPLSGPDGRVYDADSAGVLHGDRVFLRSQFGEPDL